MMFSEVNGAVSVCLDGSMRCMLHVHIHACLHTDTLDLFFWRVHMKSPFFTKTGSNFYCVRLSAESLHLTAAELLLVLSITALSC